MLSHFLAWMSPWPHLLNGESFKLVCLFRTWLWKDLNFAQINISRFKAGNICSEKISHHSISRCNNVCMNRWKTGYPKFVSLKSWSQQNPFVSVERNHLVWNRFEMLRTDHPTHLARFFSFRRPSLLKRYSIKRNTSCKFVVLLHTLKRTSLALFSSYFPILPHKKRSSHPVLDPCPVKLGRVPKWRHFWRAIDMERQHCLMSTSLIIRGAFFVICGAFYLICGAFCIICGAFHIICTAFLIICGAFVIICGAFVIICGAFVFICGAFVIICSAFVIICGPFVVICSAFVFICGAFVVVCGGFVIIWSHFYVICGALFVIIIRGAFVVICGAFFMMRWWFLGSG